MFSGGNLLRQTFGLNCWRLSWCSRLNKCEINGLYARVRFDILSEVVMDSSHPDMNKKQTYIQHSLWVKKKHIPEPEEHAHNSEICI
jgi:hypothetical protein